MTSRSLPQPSPFAGLDAKRIAANSLALAIHAVAFAVLLVPSTWSPPPARPKPDRLTVVPIVVPTPEIIPTTAPHDRQPPVTPVTQPVRPVSPVAPVQAEAVPVVEDGSEIAPDVAPDPVGPVDFTPAGPQVATLAYDVSPPPRYPRQALRTGATGKVVLRVLVDEQGLPREVSIETSSGHAVLDRAAREQVLSKWRFHPATHQGRPIPAYALVPIGFSLP